MLRKRIQVFKEESHDDKRQFRSANFQDLGLSMESKPVDYTHLLTRSAQELISTRGAAYTVPKGQRSTIPGSSNYSLLLHLAV